MRFFAREIGSAALLRLDFHFLAGLDLDESFGGGAILLIGFQPDRSAKNLGIVIHGSVRAGPAVGRLAAVNLVRAVQFVAPRAHGNFQPTVAIFVGLEQRSVGAGDGDALGVRKGVADVIRSGIEGPEGFHRAVQFRFMASKRTEGFVVVSPAAEECRGVRTIAALAAKIQIRARSERWRREAQFVSFKEFLTSN